jgi:DNA (cytosine-5)-methyltransferase 1
MMMRAPIIRGSFLRPEELVFDCFAGGGGASIGIERALNRHIDYAINHDPAAICMHQANHPHTQHFCEDIYAVDPVAVCKGRPVGFVWFSPDCTHHSRAKGGVPRSKHIRGLADVVVQWAKAVRPRVICLENVEEFQEWGPLDDAGFPIKERAGEEFERWLGELRALGYQIEFRSLVAADYGVPTTRKRLFMVARIDDVQIEWPEPTHGKGRSRAWRSAAEIIDWSLPCPSIFDRKKPLAEASMRRIAAGVRRYVMDSGAPFIVPVTHPRDARVHGIHEPVRTVTGANRGELALVAPLLTKGFGGPNGNGNAGLDVRSPVGAVTAKDHHNLVAAFLTKFYGTSTGADVRAPLPTVTSGGGRGGGHLAEVRAFLVKYYGTGGQQQTLFDPLHTVTSKARFGLVVIAGDVYEITDIGMRMLAPHELFAAQGFPTDYNIAPLFRGRPMTKTTQIALAGNSVCPQLAEALVSSNIRGETARVA